MTCKRTQADRLFSLLRRRAMTYGEMLDTHISTSPWKRLAEAERYLDGERLVRGKRDGLVTFRVVKAREEMTQGVRI